MIHPNRRAVSLAAVQARFRNSDKSIAASGSSGPNSSVASHGASCFRYFALKQVPRRTTTMLVPCTSTWTVASHSRSQVTAHLPSWAQFEREVERPQDELRGASPFWMPPTPSLLLFEQACGTTLPCGQMPLFAVPVPSRPPPLCRRPLQSESTVLPSVPPR